LYFKEFVFKKSNLLNDFCVITIPLTFNKEIKALVQLLDDPDKAIFEQIKNKLLDIGPNCIPQLEIVRFEENYGDLFKERAKELIHEINFKKVLLDHEKWLKQPMTLIDGIMHIDQYFFPNVTKNYIDHEISEMVKDINSFMNNNMSAIEKVKVINQVIFEIYKVRGDKKNYHNPKNSSFGSLLKSKKGNPLAISILYIEISRKLGLPIKGINLPNHFIVGYLKDENLSIHHSINNQKKEDVIFYINPFSKGVILKHTDIEDFIKEIKMEYNEYYFTPCNYADITKRMLTNLIYSYSKTENHQIKTDLKNILALYD
jgi:regulator of sirC expression with transglutaminase-like and TPR domain